MCLVRDDTINDDEDSDEVIQLSQCAHMKYLRSSKSIVMFYLWLNCMVVNILRMIS